MSARSVEALQQYLKRLCDRVTPPEDAVLLKRFVEANDRDAFEMVVARHGPMVLGTARRLVDESHDAEDVFQAVFLSLARLAKSIRHGRTLPAWLHRATGRSAAKVHANRPDQSRAVPEALSIATRVPDFSGRRFVRRSTRNWDGCPSNCVLRSCCATCPAFRVMKLQITLAGRSAR